MDYEIKCSGCGRSSPSLLHFKCQFCGQPLTIELNMEFEPAHIHRKDYSAWRYLEFFPYVKKEDVVTLGEGWTPLVRFSGNLYLKLESLNPTGSFKDRGSSALVSALCRLIGKAQGYLSEDSSGNAGASIAAYAARSGLKAKIYVPETVSGPKFNQIKFYGAEITRIAGSRSRVAEEAQKTGDKGFYVGHILHPLFRDGIRSLAYEMAEHLGWRAPDRVYLPVSAGTLLLGVIDGFSHLVDSGVIDAMPTIVACQTSQISPLYHRLKNLTYSPPARITSIADALMSLDPPLLNLMVERLTEVNGDSVTVEEAEIFEAFRELAQHGFFVEPSSAVAYAGYKKQLEQEEASRTAHTVMILTGAGLKTALKPS